MRTVRRMWRRFYRKHREGCEIAGAFLGAFSVFAWIFSIYILAFFVGGVM